jgi:hypothetical protein
MTELGESVERAVRISERCEGEIGEELRAVLADAHALLLVPPRPIGEAQDLGGPPRGDRSRREEPRVVRADDLVGGVALDALGTRVPGADVADRVEHVDRVIPDRVDERAVVLLAVRQRLLGDAGALRGLARSGREDRDVERTLGERR